MRPRGFLRAGVLTQHSPLAIAAAISYALGIALRLYVLAKDPPYSNITSDAVSYLATGSAMAGVRVPSIEDVIWPPGMAGFLGAVLLVDPTLHLGAWLQTGFSCLLPLLLGTVVYRWFGLERACVALMAASLDFGLIHQTRIFYSDSLFTFVSFLALLPLSFLPAASTRARAKIAAATGLGLGVCFVVRTTTLPITAVALIGLALLRPERGRLRGDWKAIGVGALSFLPLFVASSIRCTRLNVAGRFCVCTLNTLLNVILGHSGMNRDVAFAGDDYFGPSSWTTGLVDRSGVRTIACSIGNNAALLTQIADDWLHHPRQMIGDSLRNVALLFDISLSGDMNSRLFGREVSYVWETAFLLIVIAPGLWRIVPVLRDARMPAVARAAAMSLVGLFVVSGLAMGLPRYRVAFDPMLILVAVSSGAVRSPGSGAGTANRSLDALLGLLAAATLLLASLFLLSSFAYARP
jgi:hypothetical protein